jgi:transposase
LPEQNQVVHRGRHAVERDAQLGADHGGQLLALHITPADAQDRAQVVTHLTEALQQATGQTVEVAFVDQGYTGEQAMTAATEHGIRLQVVKLPQAKRGFVVLPRRWVVERSFAWTSRLRRLARDYERLQRTPARFHSVAFAMLAFTAALPILGVL